MSPKAQTQRSVRSVRIPPHSSSSHACRGPTCLELFQAPKLALHIRGAIVLGAEGIYGLPRTVTWYSWSISTTFFLYSTGSARAHLSIAFSTLPRGYQVGPAPQILISARFLFSSQGAGRGGQGAGAGVFCGAAAGRPWGG